MWQRLRVREASRGCWQHCPRTFLEKKPLLPCCLFCLQAGWAKDWTLDSACTRTIPCQLVLLQMCMQATFQKACRVA